MRFMTVELDAGPEPVWLRRGSDDMYSLRQEGYDSLLEFIERVAAGGKLPADLHPRSGASLGTLSAGTRIHPPISRPPRNIMCVAANYVTHIGEGDRPRDVELPEQPGFFTKPWTSIIGDGDTIPLHESITSQVDWEAEVVVVIGKGGIDIPQEEALDHVFGYMLGNDVSARDLQRAGGRFFRQFYKGKGLDGFAPTGPAIVSADEVGDPEEIAVELRHNGERRQAFRVSEMLHPIPKLIAYLSMGMRLLPGDLIFTGTSSGVGLWHKPPIFLKDGDVVEIRSEKLGALSNPVRAGAARRPMARAEAVTAGPESSVRRPRSRREGTSP